MTHRIYGYTPCEIAEGLVPGAVYHVTARGNERQRIFRDAADYEGFLEQLALAVERYGWVCHGYCLMGNHYHLLLETPRANLPIGMRHLNGGYSRWFNRRWHRVGHLFQGAMAPSWSRRRRTCWS